MTDGAVSGVGRVVIDSNSGQSYINKVNRDDVLSEFEGEYSEGEDEKLIVNKGTTAETYFVQNHPEIELLKYEQNTEAFQALKDGRGAALAHDNTLLFAWARENQGYTTGITKLGSLDYIAPAVKKGNIELKDWLNEEIEKLASEQFFHKDFAETLLPAYGESIQADDVVIDGGKVE